MAFCSYVFKEFCLEKVKHDIENVEYIWFTFYFIEKLFVLKNCPRKRHVNLKA